MKKQDLEAIRLRAYEIYQSGDRGNRSELEDWIQAEWECSVESVNPQPTAVYPAGGLPPESADDEAPQVDMKISSGDSLTHDLIRR